MNENQKWIKFKNELISKINENQKWMKFKNELISKMNEIQKWMKIQKMNEWNLCITSTQ